MELTKQQKWRSSVICRQFGEILNHLCLHSDALPALQFVVAYQHIGCDAMFFRMFVLALIEAGLAVVFFMHLGSENRLFVTWIAIVTLFSSLRPCNTAGQTVSGWSMDAPGPSYRSGVPQ